MSMAILKVRDSNGNVQEIVAIKGDKGDKGDPGEFTGGELLNAHINNTNNPHSITAEQIGARPDTWIPTAKQVGAAPAIENTDFPGCYYRIVDGNAEWINPPMVADVEYRTTERWNGKPIYTKALYRTFASTTVGSESSYVDYTIEHGIAEKFTLIKAEGSFSVIEDTVRRCLPYVTISGGIVNIADVEDVNVSIRFYKAQFNYLTALIYIYYTKD
jgi:hypothetical protein